MQTSCQKTTTIKKVEVWAVYAYRFKVAGASYILKNGTTGGVTSEYHHPSARLRACLCTAAHVHVHKQCTYIGR